jgi:hypothetical protein
VIARGVSLFRRCLERGDRFSPLARLLEKFLTPAGINRQLGRPNAVLGVTLIKLLHCRLFTYLLLDTLAKWPARTAVAGPGWPNRCLQYPFVAGRFWRFTRLGHGCVMSLLSLRLRASQRARSAVFGCVDCIAASSRAASLHCTARVSSMLRNTGSSVCSAARVQSAAWSS